MCCSMWCFWRKPAVPFLPTNPDLFDIIFSIAKLGKEDVFYDLGCGDGRIVIEAARRTDVKKAVGIEIDERLVEIARKNAEKSGVSDRVEIIHGDFFTTPISEATVVYMYLTRRVNELLKPKLSSELRIGARIITLDFEIPGWRPVSVTTLNRVIQRTLYLYVRGVSDAHEVSRQNIVHRLTTVFTVPGSPYRLLST